MFGTKKKIQALEEEIHILRKEFKDFTVELKKILNQMLETDEDLARKAANQDKLNMMFYNILEVKGNEINH